MVVFGVGAICLAIAAYVLSSRRFNMQLASISVDYFAALGIFSTLRHVAWPPFLADVFRFMSAFMLRLDVVTIPECSFSSVTFEAKFFFVIFVPLMAAVVLACGRVAKWLYALACMGQKSRCDTLWKGYPSLLLTVLYYLFLLEAYSTMAIFACQPSTPPTPDGSTYVELDEVERCWQPGTTQMFLLPFALVALVAYVLVYPIVLVYCLWMRRETIYKDRILTCLGFEYDALEQLDPEVAGLRANFGRMYSYFRPEAWYWIGVLIARKGVLALCVVAMTSTPSFQLAFMLLTFFVSYLLQLRFRPFLTDADKSIVLYRHEVLVRRSGPASFYSKLQTQIHASLKAFSAAGGRAMRTENWQQLERELLEARLGISSTREGAMQIRARQALAQSRNAAAGGASAAASSAALGGSITRAMRDYNLIESAFLVFPILLSLAGLMFMSQRLRLEWYRTERDVLGWIVVVIIFASFLLFLIVFGYDIYRQAGCGRSAQLRAQLHASLEAKKKNRKLKSEAKAGKPGKTGGWDDSMAPEDMVVDKVSHNPMLDAGLKQAAEDMARGVSPKGIEALKELLGREPTGDLQQDLADLQKVAERLMDPDGEPPNPQVWLQLVSAQQALLVRFGNKHTRALLKEGERAGAATPGVMGSRTRPRKAFGSRRPEGADDDESTLRLLGGGSLLEGDPSSSVEGASGAYTASLVAGKNPLLKKAGSKSSLRAGAGAGRSGVRRSPQVATRVKSRRGQG
jgi:hypothetical protein